MRGRRSRGGCQCGDCGVVPVARASEQRDWRREVGECWWDEGPNVYTAEQHAELLRKAVNA